jgi:hypothetical protein
MDVGSSGQKVKYGGDYLNGGYASAGMPSCAKVCRSDEESPQ